MPLGAIRTLIIDDSALIRTVLADHLAECADIEVVGKAINGKHGVELVRELRPDVVVLDLHMPVMNGLDALDAILDIRPVPVIVFSAVSQEGAETALEALDRGAVDFLPKPSNRDQVRAITDGALVERIRAIAYTQPLCLERTPRGAHGGTPGAPKAKEEPVCPDQATDESILGSFGIAIGISTGGPPALADLFRQLQPPLPPIFVVQHMPAPYTGSLARRLNEVTALTVREATSCEPARPNHVYIAPGGRHLRIRRGTGPRISCMDGAPVQRHKPSIDVLMKSVAEVYGARATGLIMTGMGRDGVEGCRAIAEAGGTVFGQDQASSAVYGMNKLAFSLGVVHEQFSLTAAGELLTRHVRELLFSAVETPTG